MSSNRVSYMKVLKEAITKEWDNTKALDTKGPMIEPILQYGGDGELNTHKDVASILERYYYRENKDLGVSIEEHEDNVIDEVPADNIKKTMDDTKEEIDDGEEGSVKFDDEDITTQTEAEEVENAVIQKLIEEMESEEDEEEEVEECKESVVNEEAAEEEELSDDDLEEALQVLEKEEAEEDTDEDLKDLDVDEEISENMAVPSLRRKAGLGTGEQHDEVTEAFNIFKKQIEEDD